MQLKRRGWLQFTVGQASRLSPSSSKSATQWFPGWRAARTTQAGIFKFETGVTPVLLHGSGFNSAQNFFGSSHGTGGAFAETVRADFIRVFLGDRRAADQHLHLIADAGLLHRQST